MLAVTVYLFLQLYTTGLPFHVIDNNHYKECASLDLVWYLSNYFQSQFMPFYSLLLCVSSIQPCACPQLAASQSGAIYRVRRIQIGFPLLSSATAERSDHDARPLLVYFVWGSACCEYYSIYRCLRGRSFWPSSDRFRGPRSVSNRSKQCYSKPISHTSSVHGRWPWLDAGG